MTLITLSILVICRKYSVTTMVRAGWGAASARAVVSWGVGGAPATGPELSPHTRTVLPARLPGDAGTSTVRAGPRGGLHCARIGAGGDQCLKGACLGAACNSTTGI